MAAELFVDTSAWYPAVVANHPQHQAVARALRDRVKKGHRVVTTNLVVMETHALLLTRVHRAAALNFVLTVRETPNLIVHATPSLEADAVEEWLERFDDQPISFCDAVSFAVMKQRHIAEALTLDRHFLVAGFSVAPK